MALALADVAAVAGPLYSIGNLKCVVKDVTFDASYPTGGESLTPADVGLTVIVAAWPSVALHSTPTTAVGVVYNAATAKLIALYATANAANVAFAEATNTNDLSAFTARMVFLGY
jgi:hypothetical protein